jgi:uncharacterized protein (TIGR02118 family)
MIFASGRSDLATAAFDRHLRETHAPLVAQLPGLRRFVLNRALPDDGAPAPGQLIAEDWFDSLEALQAAMASPQGQAVNADAAAFLDMSTLRFQVVREEEVPLQAPALG